MRGVCLRVVLHESRLGTVDRDRGLLPVDVDGYGFGGPSQHGVRAGIRGVQAVGPRGRLQEDVSAITQSLADERRAKA
ncbi:hypothetical protein M514_24374 [Trichuris suis]|uniref:Uncharacterized protein n=1 Tax=Trichuris suis TaxID=68888 RepID=A0A085N1V2_9BILA|nr:hypothetical protein M514_24374 [Trichuris suis]